MSTPITCMLLAILAAAAITQTAYAAGDAPPADLPEPAWTVNVWPGEAPGSEGVGDTEYWEGARLFDVSVPTLSYYPADKARAKGMCVMFCPGGAYRRLFYKHLAPCVRMLHAMGIDAAWLKYRCGKELDGEPGIEAKAVPDALRAMRIIRSRADELGLRPDRIGAMGSSAGGNLVVKLIMRADRGDPEAKDPLDRISARPDFAGLMYPSVHDLDAERFFKDAPPVFVVQAANDRIPHEAYSELFAEAYKARSPYELHIFHAGGHGFGFESDTQAWGVWPAMFERWLLHEVFKYLESFWPDYLASVGGEAAAELKADSKVKYKDVEGNERIALVEDMTAGENGSLASKATEETNGRRVAYAFCYIKSDSDQKARFYFGSEDEARVWVNGDLLCKMDSPLPFRARERAAEVHLTKGLNRVMVKASQHNASWLFRFELMARPAAETADAVDGEPVNTPRRDGQVRKWRVMNFHLDKRQLW